MNKVETYCLIGDGKRLHIPISIFGHYVALCGIGPVTELVADIKGRQICKSCERLLKKQDDEIMNQKAEV